MWIKWAISEIIIHLLSSFPRSIRLTMLVTLCLTSLVSLSLGNPVPQEYLYTPNFTPVFFFPSPLVYSEVSKGDDIAEVVEPDETINSRTCSEEGGLFQNPENPKDWYICVSQEDGSLKVQNLSLYRITFILGP